ncbi:MAG: class I SAM-dependent methyltransferase [Ilumatobacteraceae bacterium]
MSGTNDPGEPYDRLAMARSFDATAAAYELGRPGYPAAAIEWWVRQGAFPFGGTVLDLAAGTGKLTRSLVARGCDVVAVEPLANMRAELAAVLPGMRTLDGTAEQVPLPDGCVDAVFVGQAFHWFDQPVALAEIHRVLRPGGGSGLGLIWNDDVRPAAAGWAALAAGVKHEIGGGAVQHGIDQTMAAVAMSDLFGPAQFELVAWSEETTAERVLASVLSRSYVTVLDEAGREEVLAPIRAALAEAPAPLVRHHVASTFWCPRI